MDPAYSFHFRHATVEAVVDLLTRAGARAWVLGANAGWCSAVLPRADDERARLRTLADLHPAGVLLYNVGPAGDRILWHKAELVVVDAMAATRLHRDGLVNDVFRARLAAVSPRGHEWIPVLGLPEHARATDLLLERDAVDAPEAVAVGRAPVAAPAPVVPTLPKTGQELFELLLATGAVELAADADPGAVGARFAEQVDHGGAAAAAWLLACPDVAAVYVSDEALQTVLDASWPSS